MAEKKHKNMKNIIDDGKLQIRRKILQNTNFLRVRRVVNKKSFKTEKNWELFLFQ